MDILYYSNYCKHSQKIIQFIVKSGFSDKINSICIDKRYRDPKTGQTLIKLENGNSVILPPNVHSVPCLLVVKENYKAVLGEEIIKYFEPMVRTKIQEATGFQGEPQGFQLGGTNNGMYIVSEQFTPYNMSSDDLSAKGKGGMRQMYNYVQANHDQSQFINTPPDTYRPDKISNNVTIDSLQQQRNDDIAPKMNMNPTMTLPSYN